MEQHYFYIVPLLLSVLLWAQNWEYHYGEVMTQMGLVTTRASPCVFRHAGRDLRVVVHGDDFAVLGPPAAVAKGAALQAAARRHRYAAQDKVSRMAGQEGQLHA